MNRTASLLIVAASAVCAVLFGQATEGSILGAITDASGAVVTSAKVSVTNADTGVIRTTTPSQTGEYLVSNLPPGRYSVTVEAPGFRRAGRCGPHLEPRRRRRPHRPAAASGRVAHRPGLHARRKAGGRPEQRRRFNSCRKNSRRG